MSFEIVLSKRALQDARRLRSYITRMSGPELAASYLDRLSAHLATLRIFPDRGTKQANGSRRIGFERRIQVDFQLHNQTVIILRIRYAGYTR